MVNKKLWAVAEKSRTVTEAQVDACGRVTGSDREVTDFHSVCLESGHSHLNEIH